MVPVTCWAAAMLVIASEPAKQKKILLMDRREKVPELSIFLLP
jgi:hypothetical protein